MGDQSGERIRVILRKIKVHDNLEPAWDEEGEFRFTARISSRNQGGLLAETKLPKNREFYRISDKPMFNELPLNEVLFEGRVEDHLEIEIIGEELDKMSANDQLTTYRRVFEGSPSSWIGEHRPGDEGSDDPEKMKDWWIYLEIEQA